MSACVTDEKSAPTLRLGTNVWPGYAPLYLAQKMGEWSTDEIRLVEYPSTRGVMRAISNRSLEAASLTLDEVMLLRQHGLPVQVILVHDISDGADSIVARAGLDSMLSLRGKRIAVETGALGAYLLTRALDEQGMTIDDISVVNSSVNTHATLFEKGKIDAAVTYEPMRSQFLSKGGTEVFNSREIAGEIVDVLVVHQDFIDKHPERVKLLAQGWFNALSYMRRDMNSAVQLMAARLHLSEAEMIASYDGLTLPDEQENKRILTGESPQIQRNVEQLRRVMLASKLLSYDVNYDNLVNSNFIP